MRRLYVLTTTAFLAASLVATAGFAAEGKKDSAQGKKNAPQTTTEGTPKVPQGVKNLYKVMDSRIERSKKMHQKIGSEVEKVPAPVQSEQSKAEGK